jgi:hypothetical protein
MSDVTTNPTEVKPGEQAAEQVAQAAQLSAEQQAEVPAEAKKEFGLVVKAPSLAGAGRERGAEVHGQGFGRSAVRDRRQARGARGRAVLVARKLPRKFFVPLATRSEVLCMGCSGPGR